MCTVNSTRSTQPCGKFLEIVAGSFFQADAKNQIQIVCARQSNWKEKQYNTAAGHRWPQRQFDQQALLCDAMVRLESIINSKLCQRT